MKPPLRAVNLRVDADYLPRRLNNGPPELPGLMATSVLDERRVVFSFGRLRPLAETMPEASLLSPKGAPMAATHSPGFKIFRIADFDNRQVFLRLDF